MKLDGEQRSDAGAVCGTEQWGAWYSPAHGVTLTTRVPLSQWCPELQDNWKRVLLESAACPLLSSASAGLQAVSAWQAGRWFHVQFV